MTLSLFSRILCAALFAGALVAPAKSFAQSITASAAPSPTPSPAATAATPAPSPSPAVRRALPAPLDPIFPSSDYNGPTIGVPTDRGIRAYGWIDGGVEMSTSKFSNTPLTYNPVPNAAQLDQFVFRVERQPDTVQTEHPDWGFRVSNIYGVDWRYTTAEGWWSDQLLKHNRLNGYDAPELYGMLYLPHVSKGTLFQIGRYISPPDIEAQLAPSNFLYSHSLMFSFDAYTQTGILGATKLSDYWTIMYGVHGGNDMAPWDASAHVPTFELFGRWVSHSNKDSVLFGADAVNFGSSGGKMRTFTNGAQCGSGPCLWGHDNLQQYNATWTHAFNPGFQNQFEAYYIYEFDAFAGGTINNGPFAYGAGGGPGVFLPGRSNAVGLVDYLEYKFSPKDFLSFRTDYLNDSRGERSGFATSYGSVTLGVTHRYSSTLEIRPEIRFEKAFASGITPYDNGTKNYQTTYAIDVIQNFGNP